jgi:hypothetical protein
MSKMQLEGKEVKDADQNEKELLEARIEEKAEESPKAKELVEIEQD